jgi:hypothetical protein
MTISNISDLQLIPLFFKKVYPNNLIVKVSNPITDLERPIGFQEFEAPRFQGSRHMKVERLPAVRTGRLYPPGIIPNTHFC